jgi:hypothetical protein
MAYKEKVIVIFTFNHDLIPLGSIFQDEKDIQIFDHFLGQGPELRHVPDQEIYFLLCS